MKKLHVKIERDQAKTVFCIVPITKTRNITVRYGTEQNILDCSGI